MRLLIPISLTLALLTASASRCEDSADARKIIDKALKAHGNPTDKQPAVTWKGKGTFYGMGDGLPYSGTWSIQPPDKFKIEVDNAFVIVVNGDKGWMSFSGSTMDMTAEQVAEQRENIHSNLVSRLFPLRDKAYTLSLVGDSKVGDKPAVAVKVSHKGRRDVTLSFDKETGLLVKLETQVKDDQTGEEKKQESFVTDYVTVDGVKLPRKMLIKRDGKDYVDGEMSDYKSTDKLPDGTFAKP